MIIGMKKLFVFFAMLVAMSASGQWVKVSNGLSYNSTVWSLASSGNNIFAGSNFGVYKTTNDGLNWTRTNLNNSGNSILADGNNVYAGTNNGVYITSNNGQNWSQIGPTNKWVWALAKYGDTIFAGTDGGTGIFRTTNYGISWTRYLDARYIISLAINGNNIFAGDLEQPIVWHSTNNGQIWDATYLGGQYPRVVLSLAIKDSILFAGTDNDGIFYTTDNGKNWYQTGLDSTSVLCIKVIGDNIFAGIGSSWQNGVYLSTNDGKDWIVKNQGMGHKNTPYSLAENGQYIFAGADSCAWRRSLSEIINIQNISTETPSSYSLSQNYPNPFNSNSKLKFQILNLGDVKLVVYDILGKEVQTLVNERLQPGTYEVSFDGSQLTSGVYFYKLMTDGYSETKKMLLIK
jgi:photosystem II stability/assembly factor-like uncharacterized protein